MAAGVEESTDLGRPPVADLPSTRFTLTTAAGTVVREVYALDYALEGDGMEADLTDEQVNGRARLRDLLTALFDAGQQPARTAPVERYVPAAVAAIATPGPIRRTAWPPPSWRGPARSCRASRWAGRCRSAASSRPGSRRQRS